MERENDLCSLCLQQGSMFCPCTNPETVMCTRCIEEHSKKNSRTTHQALPIKQLRHYKVPGYFDRLQIRMVSIAKVREQALDNIREVDRAIDDYNLRVETAIWEVMANARMVVAELNQVKTELIRDINAALEEVELTLVEDQPVLTTHYGPVFRGLAQRFQPFHLFKFDIQAHAPQTRVSGTSFRTQRTQDISREWLSVIYGNSVDLHNLSTSTSEKHLLTVDFKEGGSFVESGNVVLCFGGSPASTAVYSLTIGSFELQPQRQLNAPRKAPGLAKANGFIYVFGGNDSSNTTLNSCEKWSMRNQSMISSMAHPRAFFVPCTLRRLIYLVSADAHKAIETFDLDTETCSLLPVTLPAQLEKGKYSVAFIAKGELVLLTSGKQVARWEMESVIVTVGRTDRSCWSGQLPVVVGNQVLVACEGCVEKFNLETYAFY